MLILVKRIFWNEREARLRAGWRLLIQLALNIGLAVLALKLVRRYAAPVALQSSWADLLDYTILLGVTLLSVWFAGRFVDRRQFSDFGIHFNSRAWWMDFIFGLMLGAGPLVVLALVAAATNRVTLKPMFTSGIAGAPFALGALVSVFQCICIGAFEELARGYHIRNLLEGLNGRFGVKGAMIAAAAGASMISVLMHRGHPAFLLFVFVSMAIYALYYLLTGRVAIATGHHIAWNFVLATVLVVETDISPITTTFYTVRLANTMQMSDISATLLLLGVFSILGYELVNLLLTLIWVWLRYGRIGLCEELATPTLLPSD